MHANEIKKAWNTFKKEAQKEISFSMSGSCYMNAKQIANGTATITLCSDTEYDACVRSRCEGIEMVNGYTTWTDEEKKNYEARNLEEIRFIEDKKAKYGNKANEANVKAAEIRSSKAFKKLAEAIGITAVNVELVKKWEGLNCYQIRIHY